MTHVSIGQERSEPQLTDFCIVDVTETTRHVRALFISDVHLGSRACKAEQLLDFLRHHDADTIYLVGDIVDGWQLRSSWYWPQAHNDVVQKLLRQARKGVRTEEMGGAISSFTAIISISWSRRRAGSRSSAAGPTTSPSPSIAYSTR